MLGAPFLLLVPLALWRSRWALAVLAISALAFLFPLLGLKVSFPKVAAPEDIQILSVNVADARGLKMPLDVLVEASGADLVAIQECPRGFRDPPGPDIPGYEFHHHLGLCLLTRLPILAAEQMGRNQQEVDSITGWAVRYSLELGPGDTISVTNVHLPTPRAGLEDIRKGEVSKGAEALKRDRRIRRLAAEGIRTLVDAGGPPQVVLGDFNAPPESRIQREIWGDFRNAFGRSGLGFGFTRYNGWVRARIDHVLVDESWTVVAARVGEDVGSDHRPLLVRLRRAR